MGNRRRAAAGKEIDYGLIDQSKAKGGFKVGARSSEGGLFVFRLNAVFNQVESSGSAREAT